MPLAAAEWPFLVLSGVVGAVLGSFLNVCIYRMPRDVSVVFPPSACPACGERIRPYDNVPILGWLWLRGRCRNCHARIAARYPLVEALFAGVLIFLAWRYGLSWQLPVAAYFAGAMIVVTLIDLDAGIIPDSITLPGTVLGLAASLITPITFLDSAIGAALGFFLLLGIAWGYQRLTGEEGMGGGDIKFAAMLGAFLGWSGLLLTIFLASLAGTVAGIGIMILRRGGRKTPLPFGTFLAPAALAILLWGHDLLMWYAGLLRP